jgi:hypothetical protein
VKEIARKVKAVGIAIQLARVENEFMKMTEKDGLTEITG